MRARNSATTKYGESCAHVSKPTATRQTRSQVCRVDTEGVVKQVISARRAKRDECQEYYRGIGG